MGSEYTQAQKRATEKYQKTLSNISIRITKEEYSKYKQAAADSGMSLREYVLSALNEKIEREKK